MSSTHVVLYWTPSSRESCGALLALTEFTENHSPARMSWKLIFRKAKTVPVVTENSRRQAWHLKRRRRISQQLSCEQRTQVGRPSLSGQRMRQKALYDFASSNERRWLSVNVRQ